MQLFAFILYFVIVLVIGLWFFFRTKTGGDKEYFLGGRSTGPWVTAMSAQASDMSGWLLMGFPGSILAFGLGQVWIGIGLALGTIANWVLVARRLRRFSEASGDSITLPQYLTNRFATANPALKITCAVIFLISFTIYVASAFNAGAAVFVAVLPALKGYEMLAMAIFAVIVLVYTFLGGYKAVCWTDFFQGLMMLCALLIVPIAIAVLMALQGRVDVDLVGSFGFLTSAPAEILEKLGFVGENAEKLYAEFVNGSSPELLEVFYTSKGLTAAEIDSLRVSAFQTNPFTTGFADIVSGLGWGLGYFGMPHILVRFMGIKDSKMVKKSALVACIWVVLTLGAAALIAILARTFLLGDGIGLAEKLLPASAKQNVFIEIVQDIFPGFVAGLLLAAIIAASMSTADSQLLVASSSFTSDLYQPLIRKNKASEKETLWAGRIVVVIVTVIAFAIAASGIGKADSWASNIMAMVENAWGLFGAAFGPAVILSLFWRRFNYAGALAGILAGAIVDLVWLFALTGPTGIYEIVPGTIVGAIAAVVTTLVTKAPSDEVLAIYDAATAVEE